MVSKLERDYQASLIKKLEKMFPGCIILKNDTQYQQGIPDLTIFYGPHWAVLEVKAYEGAPKQPNQRWFIETLNEMYFADFIYPENEEDVLNDLQQAFGVTRRRPRVSRT